MQAASDVMLGWYRVTGVDDLKRDFYFRQLWDEKGSALIEGTEPIKSWAPTPRSAVGRWLARTPRSGEAVTISAYLGSSDALDRALADFAGLDADQNEMDHAVPSAAVRDRVRQSADGAVIRINGSIPIIRFG